MIRGSIQYTSIDGPLTRRPVRFGVYLPEGYGDAPQDVFPVLYFLHGMNQNHRDNLETVAAALEQALAEEVVRPMIIVTPEGYMNSMWADSKSGHKPAETNFIHELVPHIEVTYRSSARPGHRIIGGFSMGGYGACRHAVKFPELFTTCFSMDGAQHTLGTLQRIRGPIFDEIFENDADYFRHYCLYHLARQNRQAMGRHLFYVLVGLLKSFNDRFRRLFAEMGLGIADDHYRLTGCGHDPECILNREGIGLFRLLEMRMRLDDPVVNAIAGSDRPFQ